MELQFQPVAGSESRSIFPSTGIVSALLAYGGALVCFYLIGHASGELSCFNEEGCERVLNSPYASIGGVPLSHFGLGGYLLQLALLLGSYATTNENLRRKGLLCLRSLSSIGAAVSLVLIYIQFFIIKGFCLWCCTSALLSFGLAAVNWRLPLHFDASRRFIFVMAAVMLLSCLGQFHLGGEKDSVIAVVDGQSITRDQMDEGLVVQLEPLREMTYEKESKWLDNKINQLVLADDPHRQRHHQVDRFLKKPLPPYVKIDLATAETTGPLNAPVQLIVFSDFQCPYCARLAPVLAQVRHDYPNNVLVAYRYLPLKFHPRAIPAARAAVSASEQGKFWPYQDKLFAQGGDLSDATLLALANSMGLDSKKFLADYSSQATYAKVEASSNDAAKMGIDSTPSLFLNGRLIGGVLNYASLKTKIDQALKH